MTNKYLQELSNAYNFWLENPMFDYHPGTPGPNPIERLKTAIEKVLSEFTEEVT